MRTFSSVDFLELWECASALHPLDHGLFALSAALPELPCDVLADWPLGRRNRALAELRCRHFGPVFKGWIACPQCAERLEFEIDGRALVGEPGDLASSPPEPVTV